MRFKKVWTIFKKEIDEGVRSKYVLWSLIGMPLIFAIFIPASSVLPLMATTAEEFESDGDDLGALVNYEFTDDWDELDELQKFFIVMVEFSVLMFLLLPMILPTVIAADSFAGEKDRGTAEGMVAAPLTDGEIYIGKVSGALIPSILSLWIAAIPFVLIVDYASLDILDRLYLPNITFMASIFLLGPLLGFASTNAMIWVSTRTTSSRDAQQLGSLIVLPLFLVMVGTLIVTVFISPILLWIGILVMLIANFFLAKIGISILDRERWVSGT
ncbi:MAG: ABC transporter permease subunit [Candidatus Kariarchaeaceae archaeon]